MENLERSLLAMRDHAITNGILEIHLPKIACGKDCMNWAEVRELLLNVFRNTSLRITIHVLADDSEPNSQTDHLASTIPARTNLNQTESQCEGKISSGESMLSEETVADEDPCSEVNESTVVHDASSIQEVFSEHSKGGPPREAQSGMSSMPTQVHLASPSNEMRDQPAQESRETLSQPTQTLKQEDLMAESVGPTLSLSLSPPKDLVKCPSRRQSASTQAMSPHRSPPMSIPVGPAPKGVDPNLSLSQSGNCEQKPAPKSVQV